MEALPAYEFARHDGLGQRVRMAEQFGRVKTEHRQVKRAESKSARHYIYLGTVEVDGRDVQMVKLYGYPAPHDAAKLIPFATAEDAGLELRRIRSEIIAGVSPGNAVKPYLPQFLSVDLIENKASEYIEEQRRRMEIGELSANGAFADLERWAQPGGHWQFWRGKRIDRVSRREIKRWHAWLAERRLGSKTRKNVSDGFRTFLLAWAKDEGGTVPEFPIIATREHAPKTIPMDRVLALLEAIPWEKRGLWLAIAFESVRFSEAVAHTLEDWDGAELHWHRGRQGKTLEGRVSHGKTRSNVRREPWNPELKRWLNWRAEQTTKEQRLAGQATALFWNPGADNAERSWSQTATRRVWDKATLQCGERISQGEALRHSVLSALAGPLSERALRMHSRHARGSSLDRYTKGVEANFDAMVKILEPR